MKHLLICFTFLLVSQLCFAQQAFIPSDLIADIDCLVETYEKSHPNLYAYQPEKTFKKELSQLKEEIHHPLNTIELWLRLEPIVTTLKDGHTSILPKSEHREAYLKRFAQSGKKFLPISVYIQGSTIYLRQYYGNDSIAAQPGSRIISINGVSAAEIIKRLVALKSGYRYDYRLYCAQKTFLYDYSMIFPSVEFIIEYIDNGTSKTIVVPGISFDQTETYAEKEFQQLPYYQFSRPYHDIALITYNECRDMNNFQQFLKDTFTIILTENIGNLIIDLRNNGGGTSDLNCLLMTYLTDKPFYSYRKIEVKVSDVTKKYQGWLSKYDNDTLITQDTTFYKNTPTNKLLFKGNLFVLTSIATYSSGADCAMLLRDHNIGIFIGQETGGLATGYGDACPFELPHSGLQATVSCKYFLRPSGVDDKQGVIPHYVIKPTIADLLSEKDLEMEFVLGKIRELEKEKSEKK